MVINEFLDVFKDRFSIHVKAEVLICKKCGLEYTSRGKKDPGICKECEHKAHYIGGPLDLSEERNDNYRSETETN